MVSIVLPDNDDGGAFNNFIDISCLGCEPSTDAAFLKLKADTIEGSYSPRTILSPASTLYDSHHGGTKTGVRKQFAALTRGL